MLVLAQAWALFGLGFSLPLDPWRTQPLALRPPLRPRWSAHPPPLRRAPLAEHAWEDSVLRNLTRSK